MGKGSENAISAIEKEYTSDSAQKVLRDEVKKELNNAGRKIGHATQKELGAMVTERTQTLMNVDRAMVNGVSQVLDKTQQQVVEWGSGKLTGWIFDKLYE